MRLNCQIVFAGLGLVLAGCSTHPLVDDVTRKTTYDVVEQIRCEAKRAVVDHARGFKDAAIAYEFTFHITESNNASGDLTLNSSFFNGGGFTAKPNIFGNRTRDTLRNFKIVDSFDDLRKAECSREIIEKNWIYPIAGDIGIYEVVATFARLATISHLKNKSASGGDVFSFADSLTFTTELGGGVNPTLILHSINGRTRLIGASANLSADRKDIHMVTVGLAGGPQTPTSNALRGTQGLTALRTYTTSGSNSSLLSTTLIQNAANVQQRALLELDRQRILALQDKSQNLLVGP